MKLFYQKTTIKLFYLYKTLLKIFLWSLLALNESFEENTFAKFKKMLDVF